MKWADKTDAQRERIRLMQKLRRAKPGGTRNAMMVWGCGEKGKAAKRKWRANGGCVLEAKRVGPGTKPYARVRAKVKESIAKAENYRQRWTEGDEVALLKMDALGKTANEIAAALSRSFKGVEQKRARLKKAMRGAV